MITSLLAQALAPDAASIALTTVSPYNPIVIAMIGTQICLIIAAVVQGIVSIMAHGERKDVASKVDSVAKVAAAIEGHVNSDKTADLGKIAAKDMEIQLLREAVAHERASAGLLAQAVAVRARQPDPDPHHGVQAVEVVNQPLAVTQKDPR